MNNGRAVLNTDIGEIEVYNYPSVGQVIFQCRNTDSRIVLRIPSDSQLLRDDKDPTTLQALGVFTTFDAPQLLRLIGFTTSVAMHLDEHLKERRVQLLKERVEKADSLLAEQEARQSLIEERTEMCLNELAGERIRVRSRGYKGSPRAKMTVKAVRTYSEDQNELVETGEYVPFVVFDNEDVDGGRPRSVDSIRKLEVKRGSRYKGVWDDGEDDLPLWQREEAKEMML